MKRSTLLISAFAVFALGGCTAMGPDGGGYTATFNLPVEITEKVTMAGGTTDTYVTRITYDKDALVSGEITTENGITVKELKDYVRKLNDEGFLTQTCTRVTTGDNGTVVHKLVSTYGASYDRSWLETRFEVFTDEREPELVEYRDVEYYDDRYTSYESWTLEGGTVLRNNFNYTNASKPVQTYTEIRRKDGTPTQEILMGVKSNAWDYSQYKPVTYEMYQNIPDGNYWDGETGELIEEAVDFKSDYGENSWTIKKYGAPFDAEGKGTLISTTEVTMVYHDITIAS